MTIMYSKTEPKVYVTTARELEFLTNHVIADFNSSQRLSVARSKVLFRQHAENDVCRQLVVFIAIKEVASEIIPKLAMADVVISQLLRQGFPVVHVSYHGILSRANSSITKRENVLAVANELLKEYGRESTIAEDDPLMLEYDKHTSTGVELTDVYFTVDHIVKLLDSASEGISLSLANSALGMALWYYAKRLSTTED